MRQNWYQLKGSKWAELWTILHLPYTLMNLSFLSIGFGLGGINRWEVYLSMLLAYTLGLGLAAHSFDQLPGMGSSYVDKLSSGELKLIGVTSLVAGIALGVYWMLILEAWHLLWLIPLQSFFVWAYPNSNFMGGFFHNDFWFSFSWGFTPVMVGYYLNHLDFSLAFIPWAVLATLISAIEITLSRYTRTLRRLNQEQLKPLIKKPEFALKLLCITSYLLGIIVILGGS